MDRNDWLDAIEKAHRQRTGSFCYTASVHNKSWRLSICERGVSGHFPIDFISGSEAAMHQLAEQYNDQRLKLGPRETAAIICSSMSER